MMIKTGDRFTNKELSQSIQELRDSDVRKYLDKRQSTNTGVAIGDTFIMPYECTPDEYSMACIQAYSEIPSSADNLDNQLRDKGFRTTHRFAHRYKFGGLSTSQIIHDAYFLDWFHQIYNTAIPYDKHADKYLNLITDAFSISYYYAQYLWNYNRSVCQGIAGQLQVPGVSQWKQIISAILGIGFQFHPDDVYEYSIEHTNPNLDSKQFKARYAQQLEFKNRMMIDYEIDTGCLVLSPNSREKLQKIVTRTDLPYCWQVIKSLISLRNR